MNTPEIAIIAPSTLTCLGLEGLLGEIIPQAVIRSFRSFGELTDDTPDMYAHYFVAAQIYCEHTAFFWPRRQKTIVLAGRDDAPQLSGISTLNINQDEQSLVRSILQLHRHGHQHGHDLHAPSTTTRQDSGPALTPREAEVLRLIARGLLNKEIADRLGIGLTTVISHRKNIVEKLNIRSVSGLTIYAVMHGYNEVDEI